MNMLTPAKSLTHEHILTVINTELTGEPTHVHLLDVGCGDGELIAYLHHNLHRLHPDTSFEIYGMEVIGHGMQHSRVFEDAIVRLEQRFPEVSWRERIRMVSAHQEWPFPDAMFDVVVSNQVLEHVHDHETWFKEHSRISKEASHGIHVFPVRECLIDWHLNLPFVHRVRSHDSLRSLIGSMSKAGLGKFRSVHAVSGMSIDEYVERHADYIYFMTSYISSSEVVLQSRRQGFRTSFRYTREFYRRRLQRALGRSRPLLYERRVAEYWTPIMLPILKRVSSVTLFLEKKQTYRKV